MGFDFSDHGMPQDIDYDYHQSYVKENNDLKKTIAELKEALKPFAEAVCVNKHGQLMVVQGQYDAAPFFAAKKLLDELTAKGM